MEYNEKWTEVYILFIRVFSFYTEFLRLNDIQYLKGFHILFFSS